MEAVRVGRPCSTCSLPQDKRDEIEQDLLFRNQPVSNVSNARGISPQSLRRHLRHHLRPQLRQALARSEMNLTGLVERVVDIADGARDARLDAEDAGDGRGAARAAEAELRALLVLLSRLGVTDTAVGEALRQSEQFAAAVGQASRRDARVGQAVVARLSANGAHELAQGLSDSVPDLLAASDRMPVGTRE